MELLDKSALIAEYPTRNNYEEGLKEGRLIGYKDALNKINNLEVKEVDLEKEIKNRIDNLSNLYCYMEDLFNGKEEEGVYPIPEKVTNELFEFAKHFFELGLKAQKL